MVSPVAQVCHKKFKHKHYLASHKLLHEGVKPHICSWCGLGFTQNSNLQKHVRQKHTQEKAFVCNKGGIQVGKNSDCLNLPNCTFFFYIFMIVFLLVPLLSAGKGLSSLTTSGDT